METILIVDDNHGNLRNYEITIKDEFPEAIVLTATDEIEASKIINEHEDIDVIITDLMMHEEKAGIEVLNEAKKKNPLTVVIIITAYDKELNREKAFDLGAFDCISKASIGTTSTKELIYKTKSALFSKKIATQLIKSKKELSDSERKIESFKKYFDPNVFELIKQNPELLSPEKKIVTIAFWDIRNFSSLNEILKSRTDLIADFLKDFFEIASKIIFANSGVLDKFIGDGVMAIFGAFDKNSEINDDHSTHAIQAAMSLKNEFNSLNQKWQQKWERYTANKIDIGLGCGIHTGEAIVGNLGTDFRDHYTAIGPHVNLASRIESTSKSGEIRFSVTTKSRIGSNFKIKKIDTLRKIKNINGRYEIFIIMQ